MKKKVEKIVCDFCGKECETKCDICGRDVCHKHYYEWTWDVYKTHNITINKICTNSYPYGKDVDACMQAFNKFRNERKEKYDTKTD